jgi:hypothetical protein
MITATIVQMPSKQPGSGYPDAFSRHGRSALETFRDDADELARLLDTELLSHEEIEPPQRW